jgi:hypothetical protein
MAGDDLLGTSSSGGDDRRGGSKREAMGILMR